jgi:capsid portal protein
MNHQAKEHLQSIWNSKVKGRKNFHKLIIFDNDTLGLKNNPATDKNQNAAINFVPLTDNQRGDSLFDNYSKTNRDVIGANFRQPPALRGETPKDLNRATYLGSLQYGEYQIYSQLRRAFDWIINKHIMPEILGPGHIIEFVSNSPKITDPVERSKLIDVFGKHGGVVPNDIRQLAAEDFNTQYEPIDQPWGNQPLALTLATGGAEMSDMSNDEVQGKLEELENRIGRKLTHHMRTQGYGEDAKVTVKLPQEYDDDDMVDLEAFLDEDFNE